MRRSLAEPNSLRARPAIMSEYVLFGSAPDAAGGCPDPPLQGGASRALLFGQHPTAPPDKGPRGVSAEIGGGQSLVNRPKMTTFGLEKAALIHVVVRRVRQSVVAKAKRLRECPPPIVRGARSRTQGPIHETVVVYRSSGIGRGYRSPRFLHNPGTRPCRGIRICRPARACAGRSGRRAREWSGYQAERPCDGRGGS